MKFQAPNNCFVIIFLYVLWSSRKAGAHVREEECMNQLQPCLRYLNGNNNPPESCCRPLHNIIKSMPECLCAMMSIEGANRAEQAGINTTQAQTLPARCGQRVNPLGCIIGTPDTRNSDSSAGLSSTLHSPSLILATPIILTMGAFATSY